MSTRQLLSAFALLSLTCACLASPMLRVAGDDTLQGSRLFVNDAEVGVVGDAIPLTAGPVSTLGIERGDGLRQEYLLLLKGDRVDIQSLTQSHCLGSMSWRLEPAMPQVTRSEGAYLVTLSSSQPQFEGACSFELPNLPCYRQEAQVRIGSLPEVNAEVWIDRIPLQIKTTEVIRIPYCAGGAPPVTVTLRKNGYVPCNASVDLSSERETYDLTCTMQRQRLELADQTMQR